jgi:hypothetical protein
MKIICIENKLDNNNIITYALTIGKVYDVLVLPSTYYSENFFSINTYFLKNDNNSFSVYEKKLFMTLKDVRKQKILKLKK